MAIKGTITHLLSMQSGVSKSNKEWQKRDFVIETDGQYPKSICFSLWGDKAVNPLLTIGNRVEVDFDAESREYNGRWYTELRCYNLSALAPAPISAQESSGHFEDEQDGLPF